MSAGDKSTRLSRSKNPHRLNSKYQLSPRHAVPFSSKHRRRGPILFPHLTTAGALHRRCLLLGNRAAQHSVEASGRTHVIGDSDRRIEGQRKTSGALVYEGLIQR